MLPLTVKVMSCFLSNNDSSLVWSLANSRHSKYVERRDENDQALVWLMEHSSFPLQMSTLWSLLQSAAWRNACFSRRVPLKAGSSDEISVERHACEAFFPGGTYILGPILITLNSQLSLLSDSS